MSQVTSGYYIPSCCCTAACNSVEINAWVIFLPEFPNWQQTQSVSPFSQGRHPELQWLRPGQKKELPWVLRAAVDGLENTGDIRPHHLWSAHSRASSFVAVVLFLEKIVRFSYCIIAFNVFWKITYNINCDLWVNNLKRCPGSVYRNTHAFES